MPDKWLESNNYIENNFKKEIQGFKKEVYIDLNNRIKAQKIVEELNLFMDVKDRWKKEDFIDYIAVWKLWSHENEDLEKIAIHIIYWNWRETFPKNNILPSFSSPWTWKLQYILDNKWKNISTVFSEIEKKENDMKPKQVQTPKVESSPWYSLWTNIKNTFKMKFPRDKYPWLYNSLDVISWMKDDIQKWITNNIFSNEKQKETEEIIEKYNKLYWHEKPDFLPFCLAMKWFNKEKNSLKNTTYLTVVDYSKPSSSNRMFIINLNSNRVEYAEQSWLWKNSERNWWIPSFSNRINSNQTSLWFYRTPDTLRRNKKWTWKWLFLKWIESWINNTAQDRWIAIHPVAWLYYWNSLENKRKRREWKSTSDWCLTILNKNGNANEIMNKIKWDSLVYAYYPEQNYLKNSKLVS